MAKLNAFAWYGGKFSHLKWLLPLLDTPCHHFVDAFGGSGAVLLNRPPAPIETYNDLDYGVVNFFHCVRQYPDRLVQILAHTPYSRSEFLFSCEILKNYDPLTTDNRKRLSQIEWARLFFIRSRMAFAGMGQKATGRNWSFDHTRSRRGMSGSVSRWHACIDSLHEISSRLLRVQIEHDDALKLIKRTDRPETLFYCDPPYLFETRNNRHCYSHEMSNEDHAGLADVLNAVRGKVAVSYYDCELLDTLYPKSKWHRHYSEKHKIRSGNRITQEMLITNYEV